MKKLLPIIALCVFSLYSEPVVFGADELEPPVIEELIAEQPSLTRVGRELTILAVLTNPTAAPMRLTADLTGPEAIRPLDPPTRRIETIAADSSVSLRWQITASEPVYAELKLEIRTADETKDGALETGNPGALLAVERLPVRFLQAREITPQAEIPAPVAPKRTSDILVGAHNCPLWNADHYTLWSQLAKHPERTPALGFYNQQLPEVADWETKWAVEHGVDFFIYCWYRAKQGGPVETRNAEALHEALFPSRFGEQMKFTLMWENQGRGSSGVADEADLLNNLFPYWMENYFKRPNYVKIDNKPLLFIYRPEFLIDDLGGVENVRSALDKIREAAKKEGFDGLWILGEYRGTKPEPLNLMKSLGLDASFSYCWPIPNSPSPNEAISRQMDYLRAVQDLNILPQIATASQAWSGWKDEGSIWKLPPEEFEVLLRRVKSFVETEIPAEQLGRKMIILDNWNEWSEGHYILPYTEYGFGYLDAVANVFTEPANHEDLLPGDLGKGGYDAVYRKWREERRAPVPEQDRWDFTESAEGWRSMMGNAAFDVRDGMLSAESVTNDPAVLIKFNKSKRADKFRKFRIRMKSSAADETGENQSAAEKKPVYAQFLWIGQPDEDWSEKKSLILPLVDDGAFHDYVFPLADSAQWNGRIAGLRFDYAGQKGVRVEIDEIALEK